MTLPVMSGYCTSTRASDEPENLAAGPRKRFRFRKDFHVSPFMDMDHAYTWRFSEPGKTLTVHMSNYAAADAGTVKMFDATLSLQRREITGRTLASVLVSYPLITARVAVGIYWQALRLWLKRVPFFVHPAKRSN